MSDANNNAPCEKGQNYALKITDLNHQGDGVGKIEGFTLFVPRALPGEDVQVVVTALHKNYGEARITTIEKLSADRVEPLCPYFGSCGGCQLQHFAYSKQLSWKQNMVTETLRRIAGIEAPVLPIIAMDEPWHYRNKAQIHIAKINSRVVNGFYEQGSHNIIDLKQCPVQHPLNEEMINILRRALQKYSEQSGETETSAFPITSAVVRTSFQSGRSVVALIPMNQAAKWLILFCCTRVKKPVLLYFPGRATLKNQLIPSVTRYRLTHFSRSTRSRQKNSMRVPLLFPAIHTQPMIFTVVQVILPSI